jgi:acetyl esterase/lipase
MMNWILKTVLMAYALLAVPAGEAEDAPVVPPSAPMTLELWPVGRMPGHGSEKPEQSVVEGNVLRINNISNPTISVFRPPGAAHGLSALVICPGGGYGLLAYDKEGTEIATWATTLGMVGVVLKYRVPGRDGAFQDVQRALRLVRSHAAEWDIAPDRIGVIGFSAGGHLAARVSTDFAHQAYTALDAIDALSCRPDFAVLVYPAYLDKDGHVSPELPISAQTSPTFIVHNDDDLHFVVGSKIYFPALQAEHVVSEFALFSTGGHGYGLRCTKDARVWPERCAHWLATLGVVAR